MASALLVNVLMVLSLSQFDGTTHLGDMSVEIFKPTKEKTRPYGRVCGGFTSLLV
jgi:hypothetical protein